MAGERLDPEALPRLVTVGLEVGDESGLEVANLDFCLRALLCSPPFSGALPVITQLHGDALRVTYFEVEDDRPED